MVFKIFYGLIIFQILLKISHFLEGFKKFCSPFKALLQIQLFII